MEEVVPDPSSSAPLHVSGASRLVTHGAGRKGQELVESWWAPTMVMGAFAMALVAGAKCTMMEFWPQE